MRPEIEKFEKHTEKGKKKIDIICQAAAKVFYEKGFLSATLADISSAAGTTKGSIFLFFSTKDEMLFLILYRYHEIALAQLKQELNSSNSAYAGDAIQIHGQFGVPKGYLLIKLFTDARIEALCDGPNDLLFTVTSVCIGSCSFFFGCFCSTPS